jgi:hypothetical protein
MEMKKNIFLMTAALTALVLVPALLLSQGQRVVNNRNDGWSQGPGNGQGRGGIRGRGPGAFNGGMDSLLLNLPPEDVSPEELDGLVRMREEEKLARDVYTTLHDLWNLPVFENIAGSEQRHMDAVKTILDKYNLADPIVNDAAGFFNDPVLLSLYNELINRGSLSVAEALGVGATIEDLDIFDLREFLGRVDSTDIAVLYQNLMKGSRNHLRSFAGLLEGFGIPYQPQYLTQAEVDEILASPMERGIVDENGDPLYGQTGW